MNVKQQSDLSGATIKRIDTTKTKHGKRSAYRTPHGPHTRKEYREDCDCVACNAFFGRSAGFRFEREPKAKPVEVETYFQRKARLEAEIDAKVLACKRAKDAYLLPNGTRIERHNKESLTLKEQALALYAAWEAMA